MQKLRTPDFIFGLASAYQRSAVLKAAIELDLFSAVADGADTLDKLETKCSVGERAASALVDCLVTFGLVLRQGEKLILTSESKSFLDRRSPYYLGDAALCVMHPTFEAAYKSLSETMRLGRPPETGNTLLPNHPVWEDFARVGGATTMLSARNLCDKVPIAKDRPVRILDVAAGHGIYGIALAETNPNAEVFAVDWPNVLEIARANAAHYGMLERFHAMPGDVFSTDLGDTYDVVLLVNFLHHFNKETCGRLLRRVHRACRADGSVVAVEFLRGFGQNPGAVAMFRMTMLATTTDGDTYSFDEYDQMFRTAGFRNSEVSSLADSSQQVIVSYC